jgi:hypothetical protein
VTLAISPTVTTFGSGFARSVPAIGSVRPAELRLAAVPMSGWYARPTSITKPTTTTRLVMRPRPLLPISTVRELSPDLFVTVGGGDFATVRAR